MSRKIALYIHIPFCSSKCSYCDFPSFAGLDSMMVPYVQALSEEIGRSPEVSVKTVYIGGGTPSILPVSLLEEILNAVWKKFHIADCAEVSMELNPSSGMACYLKEIRRFGVNRVSIGVQSFSAKNLERLGRKGDTGDAITSIENARKAGFENLSLDLMFGIPGQTLDELVNDLKRAISFSPEHLSVYQLTLSEGTPLYASHEKGETVMPDDGLLIRMYEKVSIFLRSKGYLHYEISNFAKEGKECRHNLAYWMGEEYLGLGSGAHSYLNGKRYANPEEPQEYIQAVTSGLPATKEEENQNQRLVSYLLMRLRLLDRGLEYNSINQRFNIDFLKKYLMVLQELQLHGLLRFNRKGIRLTKKGVLLLNDVLLKFMEVK